MLNARLQRYVMIAVLVVSPCRAAAQSNVTPSDQQVTIVAETRGRLTLQSELNTKLNEAGDTITASLIEPIYAEGRMVFPKGTEFRGRITSVDHAKRLQRRGNIAIVFDRVVLPWGEEPVSVLVTAIEDWNENEKARGDSSGKMKAGRQGDRTMRNMGRGGVFGSGASLIALMFGGAAGAGGRTLSGLGGVGTAAGAISGLLLTKGGEVRSSPGAILRIKFSEPFTTTLKPPPQNHPN
ncbi:MAG TPA: hypothetical protein VLU47_03750 [Blastocatellia bacterium]|nr:hypothetical protein [Blastocatellia bacterium]